MRKVYRLMSLSADCKSGRCRVAPAAVAACWAPTARVGCCASRLGRGSRPRVKVQAAELRQAGSWRPADDGVKALACTGVRVGRLHVAAVRQCNVIDRLTCMSLLGRRQPPCSRQRRVRPARQWRGPNKLAARSGRALGPRLLPLSRGRTQSSRLAKGKAPTHITSSCSMRRRPQVRGGARCCACSPCSCEAQLTERSAPHLAPLAGAGVSPNTREERAARRDAARGEAGRAAVACMAAGS